MKVDNSIVLNAIPALVILIVAEGIYLAKERKHNTSDLLTNLIIGLVSIPLSFITKGVVLYTYSLLYEVRLFTLPSNVWYTWVVCFFADDFSYYWFHRMSHRIRFLWVSHLVHHSSEEFTFSAAMRVPWTSHFTGNFLFWVWMPLIGIEPALVLLFKSASVIYQFWMHTETINKMPGWFESVFNTPSHHRVHHGCDVEYLDKNHAGTLIVWDRLFGTYMDEKNKPTYGLTGNIKSFNPLVIEFYGWKELIRDLKRSAKFYHRFNYLFNAPGWSHDSTSKTAKQLQADLNN